MKKIEDKYKVLTQIEHILLRPGTYVGSNKPNISEKYIISDDKKKIEKVDITYIPSFLKIFDEIVMNSIDEHKRNNKLNRIDINIDQNKNKITIKDNGGIPVVIHKEYKQYVPEVIFGNLMSGSNYDDSDERIVAGLNGLGAKLTNVFSKEFIISTCDGSKKFTQKFSNNMRNKNKPSIIKAKKKFTEISYIPDLEQFGLKEIDNDHFKMIEKRIYDIAACNPNLKIYFNNEIINTKSFEDYIKLYSDDYIYEENKNKSWSIGISLSENGFQQVSFVNSTETTDGGTHLDYIMNYIVSDLRDYFNKKHKYDLKPSELKNHMFIFLNSTIINPSFSSQTKEKLITEPKDFGTEFKPSDKLIKSILKSEIVASILDWIDQKKEAEENKAKRSLNKNLSKLKVDKLIDAKGKDRWKNSIGIFEGDSSISSFRKYRDPQRMGAFALKGKFINVSEISNQKLSQNNEAINLMASIGLKLGQEINIKDLRYGRIFLYVDADTDGNSIAGLLLNFFYKYWPDIFERKMLYKVETPIVVAIPRKKGKKLLFYTQKEYNEWMVGKNLNNYEIEYKKGLAALVDDEYDSIINDPKLTLIKKDDLSDTSLEIWFGKNPNLRKEELL